MSAIIKLFRESLPEYIHTLPEKNKPAVWLPKEHAMRFERFRCYGNNRHFLMLDYDNPESKSENHTRYDIEPNFIVYNPQNNNHQAYWLLKDPVYCQQNRKHSKPYLLLRAIESAFDDKYDGDRHFSRYISRNPLYAFADTDWRHSRGHKLAELAEVVQLNQQRVKSGKRVVTSDKGSRNCMVFDDLRLWAYKQNTEDMDFPTWFQRCITQALKYNTFSNPMSLSEVRAIAKSVSQYTFNKPFYESFSEYVRRTHTSEIQAIRGAKGGKLSKGGGRKVDLNSARQTQPWVKLGISKATFYRRKKSGML